MLFRSSLQPRRCRSFLRLHLYVAGQRLDIRLNSWFEHIPYVRFFLPFGGINYIADMPPSALIIEPVMKEASSDAKKRTRWAISRGSPGRPIG